MQQQHGKVRFRVTESTGDELFITIDPVERTIDVLEYGFFMFDLRPGITFEKATELANQLNDAVATLTFMNPGKPFTDTPDEDSGVRH